MRRLPHSACFGEEKDLSTFADRHGDKEIKRGFGTHGETSFGDEENASEVDFEQMDTDEEDIGYVTPCSSA
tara:strand:+ start:336 stop:548 length:213 start_codon:yes stop_codon:yes gene_type:complete